MSPLGATFMDVPAISEQLTTRDVALLTWTTIGVLAVAWSLLRGGDIGQNVVAVVRSFFSPRIFSMFLLVIAWQLVFVYLAARIGLWGSDLIKDTVVILCVGGFATGFKALALIEGEQTWRGEIRSLLALVVVIQWISNLGTFPYIVELVLVPLAILLGGVQAVANLNEEHRRARPLINGMVTLLGLSILVWSVYRLASSWGSTEWDTVGRSFAFSFWLPATLVPAIYITALVLQYGVALTKIKMVRPPSFGARADLYLNHKLNLRRLSAFTRTPCHASEYARAQNRAERLAILRASADCPSGPRMGPSTPGPDGVQTRQTNPVIPQR